MKIRYIIKHLFFRISRAFYHARKFLAVFGLVFAIVLSSFAVFAEVIADKSVFTAGEGYYLWYSQNGVNSSKSFAQWPLENGVMFDKFSSATALAVLVDAPSDVTLFTLPAGSKVSFSVNFAVTDISKFNSLYYNFSYYYPDNTSESLYWYLNLTNVKYTYSDGIYFVEHSWDFENTTGYDLRFFRFSVGQWEISNFTGRLGFTDLKYHIWTSDEIAIEKQNEAIKNQTGTITNGWNGSGTPPAGGSVAGDLTAAEDALMSSQSSGIQQSTELFSSIGTQLQQFAPAFLAVSAFMDDISDVPLFGLLITLSLSLGIIALFLNLAPSIKSSVEYNKRQEAKKKGKSG